MLIVILIDVQYSQNVNHFSSGSYHLVKMPPPQQNFQFPSLLGGDLPTPSPYHYLENSDHITTNIPIKVTTHQQFTCYNLVH